MLSLAAQTDCILYFNAHSDILCCVTVLVIVLVIVSVLVIVLLVVIVIVLVIVLLVVMFQISLKVRRRPMAAPARSLSGKIATGAFSC